MFGRKKRRREVTELLRSAAAPYCPHCGRKAYYHICEVFQQKLLRERDRHD